MTGRRLSNIFVSIKEGKIDTARNKVFTDLDQHSGARKGAKGDPDVKNKISLFFWENQ